jgi:hypothetical protein
MAYVLIAIGAFCIGHIIGSKMEANYWSAHVDTSDPKDFASSRKVMHCNGKFYYITLAVPHAQA